MLKNIKSKATDDKFSVAEKKGRELFSLLLNKYHDFSDIYFTPDKFCSVDVYWNKGDKKCVGEIKFREKYSSTSSIVNAGLMIEKTKFDALKSHQAQGFVPFYIVIMNDLKAYIFNMKIIPNNVTWKVDKYCRDSQYHQDEKVKKLVYYLNKDDAKIIDLNNYFN